MTLRERLAAIFAVPSYAWHDAPTVSADYLELVSQFDMDEGLRFWAREYVRYHTGRCLWDVEFLTSNYQFSNCLNIGGAPYIFEYLLKGRLHEIDLVSIDINPSRFPSAHEVLGIEVINANIEVHKQPIDHLAGRFQCVVFCELFEHLRIDLLSTISLLRTFIAKDGFLYLTMPNGIGMSALQRWMQGRTGPDPVNEWTKLRNLGHMGHVREYSYFEARDVLVHCGFRIEKYMYRRKARDRGRALAAAIPILADEIVMIARPAP
jgi:hypothetical protein